MKGRVSPCDSCQRSDKETCTGCLAWQRWYCQRQALINEYAEIINPVWRYELPLHQVRKEKTNEDIPADQQRQGTGNADQSAKALPSL